MNKENMTVVLVSIAESKESIIMVADKMLTLQDLTYQYEHYGTKIIKSGNYLIGYAGVTVFADDIISHGYDESKPIHEYVKDFSNFYKKYRLAIINRILLESLGLNLEIFNSNPQNFPVQLQQTVYNELQEFDLGVEFIVCGFDNGEPKIYLVSKRGIYTTAHSIGYSAIGIGEKHVTNFFIVHQFNIDKSLKEAIYFAFQAKKSSEIASGVGNLTDICVLKKDNECNFYSKDNCMIDDLNRIYILHSGEQKHIYENKILPELENISMEDSQ